MAAVTELLIERDQVSPALAAHCAQVTQGHIGRARMMARSPEARSRRSEILALPQQLKSVTDALTAAENLVAASKDEAEQRTADVDAKELAELQTALGVTGRRKPRGAQAALKDLEDQQKARVKRMQRDALDSVLSELISYYRDVLTSQTAPSVALINADLADQIEPLANRISPEQTVQAIDALLMTREYLEGNVAPQLAMESLLISLAQATVQSR